LASGTGRSMQRRNASTFANDWANWGAGWPTVLAANNVMVVTDSDGDGLPDTWMMQYFGHTNGMAGDLSRADDDPDNDRATNYQEYRAGTSPIDRDSVMKIERIEYNFIPGFTNILGEVIAGTTNVALYWTAMPDVSYRIQYLGKFDTNNNWSPLKDVDPASYLRKMTNYDRDPQLISGTNATADRYYRIRTPQ
jgi:hypothetical protein